MRFSVIIPVYKVEDCLRQCIDSVLRQNYDDYEILLVDDGSPDSCGAICDDYAEHFPNIRVIHKENGGLSDARNYGMKHASGEYLIFIDSDDWIDEGAFENINASLEEYDFPDVLITGLKSIFNDRVKEWDENFAEYAEGGFDKERAVTFLMKSPMTWYAWRKTVKRSLVENESLRFVPGRIYEDVDWTVKLFYSAETYGACPVNFYNYRKQRADSILSNRSAKYIVDSIEIAAVHMPKLDEENTALSRIVGLRVMQSVYFNLKKTRTYWTESDKVIKCIKENRKIFKTSPLVWGKIWYIFMRVFGVRFALYVLHFFDCILKF